ncbi:MAG TPA: PilN domain-containing protein [Rhodocyclaceae bacterium]|nr:PilN domain-containing protein [Rhodocyclaceae bacterium]
MSPLWLDYRRSPPGHQRPGWLLLIVGLIIAVALSIYSAQLSGELDRHEQRVASLRRQAQRLQAIPAQAAETATPAETTAHSLQRWESLFDSLEKSADDTVTLTGLDPGAKEIAITGEAKDLASVAAYVQRLQGAPSLSRARLSEYEVIKDRPLRPVHFVVLADWRESRP